MNKIILALLLASAVLARCNHQSCLLCGENNTCQICNTSLSYASDGDGGCVVIYSQFCLLMDDYGRCHSCDKDMIPHLGVCKVADPNSACRIYGCNDLCDTCASTHFLGADGLCKPLPANGTIDGCVVYDTQTLCRECDRGYYSIGSACVQLPDKCMAPLQGGCTTCSPNYFPVSGNIGSETTDFWEKYIRYLLYGVFDEVNSRCEPNQDPNCIYATSLTVCNVCKPGYYVLAGGRCASANPVVINCERYAAAPIGTGSVCTQCKSGYYLSGNQCLIVNTGIPNCRYFTSPTLCLRCYAPFYLDTVANADPQCIKDASVPAGLAQCDFFINGRTCGYCKPNYYISNGTCVKTVVGISNCVVYTATGCSVCAAPYRLINNICNIISTNLLITSCTRYANGDGNVVCLECESNTYLERSSGRCVGFSISFCSVFRNARECLYCNDRYYLSGGACLPTTRTIPNCFVYKSATTCLFCNADFTLVTTPALGSSPDADPSTFPDLTTCEPIKNDNCAVYSSDIQCQFCIATYYLDPVTKLCVPVRQDNRVDNCSRYSSPTQCSICGGNYFLDGNRCNSNVDPVDDCGSYAVGGLTCSRCKTGHFLDSRGRRCTLTNRIPDCSYYISSTVCGECTTSAYLSGNTCVQRNPQLTNCLVIADFSCLICIQDYYLDVFSPVPQTGPRSSCVAVQVIIPDCFIYASLRTCQYCKNGLIINADGTQCVDRPGLNSVTNCAVYSAPNVCQYCATNYYLSSPTTCTQFNRVANCSRARDANNCLECRPFYYLSSTGVCTEQGFLPNCKYLENPYRCAVCLPHFYSNASKVCVNVTTRTNNCAEYINATTCNVCETGFFLNRSRPVFTCDQITGGISNCSIYSSINTCAQCLPGFYLVGNNQCASASNIPGCRVYNSATTCRLCIGDDIFERAYATIPLREYALTASRTVCIADCEVAVNQICDRCIADYYWNGTICTTVNPTLPNCRYYNANKSCRQCDPSYALVGGVCNFVQGADNCDVVGSAQVGGVCAICEPGFYHGQNNICKPVPTLIEGCLLYNQLDPTQCEVCDRTHYHVAFNGACAKIPPLILNLIEKLLCAWKTHT